MPLDLPPAEAVGHVDLAVEPEVGMADAEAED